MLRSVGGLVVPVGGVLSEPPPDPEPNPLAALQAAYAAFGTVDPVSTRPTMGLAPTEDDQWIGGVLGPDGTVFGVPSQSPDILLIETGDTCTRNTLGATLPFANNFVGGVLHSNGLIYLLPSQGFAGIGILDPEERTLTLSAMGADLEAGKWGGGVIAANGLIYCAPKSAAGVLVIDPTDTTGSAQGTATVSTLGATMPAEDPAWSGIARAANGVLYAAPQSALDVLRIDPADTSASALGTASRDDYGLSGMSGSKWAGMVLGADGQLYGVPWTANDMLIVDPVNDTAVRDNYGATAPGGGAITGIAKWQNACNGPDGRVYCFPRSRQWVLQIDPIGQTATVDDFGANLVGGSKWEGGCQRLDGTIVGVPHDDDTILKLTWPGEIDPLPAEHLLGPYLNKL